MSQTFLCLKYHILGVFSSVWALWPFRPVSWSTSHRRPILGTQDPNHSVHITFSLFCYFLPLRRSLVRCLCLCFHLPTTDDVLFHFLFYIETAFSRRCMQQRTFGCFAARLTWCTWGRAEKIYFTSVSLSFREILLVTSVNFLSVSANAAQCERALRGIEQSQRSKLRKD